MTVLPPAPQDVRVVHPDGTETVCEMRYLGINDEGIHMWAATAQVVFRPGLDRITVDVLPAKCGITFETEAP